MVLGRGQGSMEYLMTYAWVIVVVFVVGVILWHMGLFSIEGQSASTSVGFPRIKPFMLATTVNSSGYLDAVFTNGAGGPIAVLQAFCGNTTLNVPAETVAYGEEFRLNGNCSIAGKTGDPYYLEILITFNTTAGGETQTHTDKGSIRGPID
ncbi:MAG: hypothetical protein ABH834_01585 [Candidatus Altiarchaeota archaeon]